MKKRFHSARKPIFIHLLIGMVTLIGSLTVCGQTATNELSLQISRPNRYFPCTIKLAGAEFPITNIVFEISKDLKTWTRAEQIYGAFGTNPVLYPTLSTNRSFFWRALVGELFTAAEQRWKAQEPIEYRFDYAYHTGLLGGIGGTVRVRNGIVTEVTNAVEYVYHQPIPNPNLSQFATIEEVLAQARSRYETGAERVSVTFDPSGTYPARVLINPFINMVDDEKTYEVSNFQIIQQ